MSAFVKIMRFGSCSSVLRVLFDPASEKRYFSRTTLEGNTEMSGGRAFFDEVLSKFVDLGMIFNVVNFPLKTFVYLEDGRSMAIKNNKY